MQAFGQFKPEISIQSYHRTSFNGPSSIPSILVKCPFEEKNIENGFQSNHPIHKQSPTHATWRRTLIFINTYEDFLALSILIKSKFFTISQILLCSVMALTIPFFHFLDY